MKTKIYRPTLFFLTLTLFALAGCGGSGGDNSENDKQPSSLQKPGMLIETNDPSKPYISISGDGAAYGYFVDENTGKPSGLSISAPDGTDAYLAIDPETGLADYWAYNGALTIFDNYRQDVGLVNISVVTPDGTTKTYYDVYYLPPEAEATSSTPRNAEEIRAIQRSASSTQAFIKFLDTANAVSVAISASACGVSALFLSGAAAAGSAVTLPIAVPLIATTGMELAAACTAAATGLLALNPNMAATAIDGVTKSTLGKYISVENINEVVGTISGGANVAKCVLNIVGRKAGGVFENCFVVAVDSIAFVGSQTFRRLLGSVQAVRALMNDPNAKGVYCCDGPAQIKPRQQGTWKAIALGAELPVDYAFSFGRGQSTSSTDFGTSYDGLLQASHAYKWKGNYTIKVGTPMGSSNGHSVRVYPRLQIFCCTATGTMLADGTTFEAGKPIALGMEVTGGKQPYTYEFDLDAGKSATINGVGVRGLGVIYDNPGTFSAFLKVTDANGDYAISGIRTLVVGKPPTIIADIWSTSWKSPTRCAEAEGSSYARKWSINLRQNGSDVTGNIYLHACPGGGRVAYALTGSVVDDSGTIKLDGRKNGGRGGLYSSSPRSQQFTLTKDRAPVPNFAP